MTGFRRIACAGGETLFRWLGTKLGRGCNVIADWFAERAR